jgi:hypothetical protein
MTAPKQEGGLPPEEDLGRQVEELFEEEEKMIEAENQRHEENWKKIHEAYEERMRVLIEKIRERKGE